MRKWKCQYCGEEMLGEVNRCWNSSRRIDPPAPEPESSAQAEPLTAAVVDLESNGSAMAVAPAVDIDLLTHDELASAFTKEPPRRGSPFVAGVEISGAAQRPFQPKYGEGPYARPSRAQHTHAAPPLAAQYPKYTSAVGGVVAAILLGVISLVSLWFTVFGFITAALGIGFGVWGLYSDRRTLAMFALLFCALVLMLNGAFIAIAFYEILTGTKFVLGSGW
jgi:hypothetical protein